MFWPLGGDKTEDGSLPTEMVDRIQLMSGSGRDTDLPNSMSYTKPDSENPHSSRIGSAKFQVLPPITSPQPAEMAA